MASATVSFGLVTVPVRLYSAAEASGAVSFNQLHGGKCGSRLKQQLVCQKDDVVVPRDQVVKGYEFAKDQYVTFSEEEMKALLEDPSPTIEISEFVPLNQVDPVFITAAYYVGPDKGGERAYALLAAALKKAARCAIAQWAARGRQQLVMFRAIDVAGRAHPALAMHFLHLADEVRDPSEYSADTEVGSRELKMALELIKKASSPAFKPEGYKDAARERILAAVGRKVKGEAVVVATPPAGEAKPTVDLFAALQASLGKKRTRTRRAA